jgi:alpha-mannosidase
MDIRVPQHIEVGLNSVLEQLSQYKKVIGYKFLIGNPDSAHRIDFDDSNWQVSEGPVSYEKHQGTTWFRFTVDIPKSVQNVPVAGTGIRLHSFFTAPMDIYVDEELKLSETTWVDFKIPEVWLTRAAVPGEQFTVAVKMELGEKCYFPGNFQMNFAAEIVEDLEFEVRSFREELKFACTFSEVEQVLPDVFRLISESLESKENIQTLVDKIKQARQMLRPMEAAAKSRTVHMVGHAHIDLSWFWDIEETYDLIKRDFATMNGIMEEMEEFRFSQSQCAAYEMAERLYPEIFEKMKKHIAAGKWDVTASTWVEGDLNMTSGEALVRHVLYSKKYLREKFGVEPRIMWCPDTFGHSANVPQIAKKSGIDYYYFMRCGKQTLLPGVKNEYYGRFGPEKPMFWWEGMDGTRILVYNSLYSSDMNAASVLDASRAMKDKFGLDNAMYVYGTGDHGGGPTRRDLKRAKQLNSHPTTPNLQFSSSHDFFDRVIGENTPALPVEKGEMNFVFDGCYTTHADIKKYNRACENKLVSTETLVSAGSLLGFAAQGDIIERSWKSALFNQFHDIFDGSGIRAAYLYPAQTAEKALADLENLTQKAMEGISSRIKIEDRGMPFVLFNTTGWKRSECVKLRLPEACTACYRAVDADGNALSSQRVGDTLYVQVGDIPAVGYQVIYLTEEKEQPVVAQIKEQVDCYEIDTEFYWLEIKKDSGQIVSLYDKQYGKFIVRKEDVSWKLRTGVLNTLQVHYEVPSPMSSWTIGPVASVRHLVAGAKATVREDGPVVKIIGFEHSVGDSVVTQDIIVYNNSRRIDFVTHVEWNEYGGPKREAPMLKVAFTPDIDADKAAYEIPFGAVERPNKDMEVPALKWADISDSKYGFSVLNDCKYGHKVKGNEMELTLIRSGWEPDPKSDVGSHDFVYSILPHPGTWKDCMPLQQGYFLNNTVVAAPAAANNMGSLPEVFSFVSLDRENVAVAAFKQSEDGETLILRLYEAVGTATPVKVSLGFAVSKVEEVALTERKVYGAVPCSENTFECSMGSFEIKTFRLYCTGETELTPK